MSRVFVANSSNAGTTQVVVTPSASINNLSKWTVMCWIKLREGVSPVGTPIICGKTLTSNNILMHLLPGTNTIRIRQISASAISTSSANSLLNNNDTWTHVAGTYDGGGTNLINIYVNGVETSYSNHTAGNGAAPNDAIDPLQIGQLVALNNGINGDIGEFRLYNSVLTAPQIITVMNSGDVDASGLQANLALYLHLCGVTNPEPDSSGNANVATVIDALAGIDTPVGACTIVPLAYSVPDSRIFGNFPNDSRDVNGTLIYDVDAHPSYTPPEDSRATGSPIASGTYPQNSRTPGTYGPGE